MSWTIPQYPLVITIFIGGINHNQMDFPAFHVVSPVQLYGPPSLGIWRGWLASAALAISGDWDVLWLLRNSGYIYSNMWYIYILHMGYYDILLELEEERPIRNFR